MRTTISADEALKLFGEARAWYANEQELYEREAKLARQQEEEQLAVLPWYKRLFYSLDDWTGFNEDLAAHRAGEAKEYCTQQLRALRVISPRSVVQLQQRDLAILGVIND